MNKKNFSEKKTFTKKWFYVAIGFGVVFAVITTLIAISKNISANKNFVPPDKEFIETTKNRQDIIKSPYPYETLDRNSMQPKKTTEPTQNKETPTDQATKTESDTIADTKDTDEEENKKFVEPVKGKVLRKHSDDKLVHWKVLNDYRTHDGVDIEAKKNTPVKAIADGTVSTVSNEENTWGGCVTIDHKDGLKSIYKGLSDQVQVKQNQNVKAGDVIGTVGTSNKVEGDLKDHVHIAIKKGKEYKNPKDYLDIK